MGKGRLQPEFLERAESISDRCLALAEKLHGDGRFLRFVEQLAASGVSIGANLAEAGEAMSVRDFRKCLAIALKEMAETSMLIRLAVRRSWVAAERVSPLLEEIASVRRITGAILSKTRPREGVVRGD